MAAASRNVHWRWDLRGEGSGFELLDADQQRSVGGSASNCSALIVLTPPNLVDVESHCAMFSSLLQKAGFRPGLALHSTVPRLLMTAAMIGGSGSLLSAGSARAVIICNFGSGAAPVVCGTGQTYLNSDKILTLITAPTEGIGNLEFVSNQFLPPGPDNDTWNLKTNFFPNAFGPSGATGVFIYKFDIDQVLAPTAYFKRVSLGSINNTPNPVDGSVISKDVFASEADLLANINQIVTLQSFNGASDSYLFPVDTYKTLWIKDTYAPGAASDISVINNSFTQGAVPDVPGPLPVLGAGMAFGFSRKLRSRIKASAGAKA